MVRADLDGRIAVAAQAKTDRPDVARAYHGYGPDHEYSMIVAPSLPCRRASGHTRSINNRLTVEVSAGGNLLASQRIIWNGHLNEVLGTGIN